MKHLLALCVSLALGFAALPAQAEEAAPLKIVTSFSILADMAKNVAGSRATITSLVGPDADAHVFEPGPADVAMLAEADVLIINGLGFEPWLVRLAASAKSKAKFVTASYGVKPIELDEPHHHGHGHGHSHGHNHGHSHGHGHGHGHGHSHSHDKDGHPAVPHDFDPHAWQDLRNGVIYVRNIADALAEKDPANATLYLANAESYITELKKLHEWAQAEIGRLPKEKRKVITTHDAFGYFSKAYGVEFLSPAGIGTASDPSAETLARLVDQMRRENIRALFMENMGNPRMMETIARETGIEDGGTLYSDALSAPGGPAPTYVAMFRHNVPALIEAMQKN